MFSLSLIKFQGHRGGTGMYPIKFKLCIHVYVTYPDMTMNIMLEVIVDFN